MPVRLKPLREGDVPIALEFIQEANEWSPHSHEWLSPMEVLGAPNSRWYSALDSDELLGIVGFCGINWVDGSADVALGVTPKWRGKGVAKGLALLQNAFAFDSLRLHRLQMLALTDSPSCAIARSAGLTLEGTLKQCRYKNGAWRDADLYALVKEV